MSEKQERLEAPKHKYGITVTSDKDIQIQLAAILKSIGGVVGVTIDEY